MQEFLVQMSVGSCEEGIGKGLEAHAFGSFRQSVSYLLDVAQHDNCKSRIE